MQALAGSWLSYLIYLLVFANIAALVVGVLLVAHPERYSHWFGTARKPRSLRRALKPLEIPRDADTAMLRYPRALGLTLLVAAIVILGYGSRFATALTSEQGGELLARFVGSAQAGSALWPALWAALIAFIALGALAAGAVGLLALVQVDLLKRVSASANRWVSTRRAARDVATRTANYGLDQLVRTQPRLWGGIIAACALYVLAVLVWFLSRG